MLFVMFQHDSPLAALAFQFAFVAFVNNTLNLLPLLELDGYFLLMDWLELPLLRARSLAFVREDLPRKLKAREQLQGEERIFAVFGSLAMLYSVFAIWAATYFWFNRLRQVLAEAWMGESTLLRAAVVVAMVGLGVPLAFAVGVKLHQTVRDARGGVERLRHRREAARAQARLECRELVAKLRFLDHLTFAQREEVVSLMEPRRFRAGTYVVRQGEPGEHFFLIRKGQAQVAQLDPEGWPRELAILRRGDYFGELALLYHQPRSASVRALTPLEVYALDREAFEATLAPRLREYGITVERIEERSELARMSLFRHTAPGELDPIMERLQAEQYPAGADIVRQGEPGDRFYLVRRGRVQVTRQDPDGRTQVLAELGPGEYFGEMALISDAPRVATVRALEPVTVWSLDKAAFQELLLDQFHLREAISTEAERREATHLRLAGEPAA
jgi:putative peptide zinc metalloprotease protein